MKDYEVGLYEKYCKHCKNIAHCPWLSISNETCFEMTAYKEKKDETDGQGKRGEETD